MQVSIIKEINPHEQRVAASPESVKLLQRLGAKVLIENFDEKKLNDKQQSALKLVELKL